MMLEVMVAIADEDFDAAEQLIADTKSVGVTDETTERYEFALTNAREAKIKRETDSLNAIFASATPAAVLANSGIEHLPVTDLLPDPLWDTGTTDDFSAQPEPSLDLATVPPVETADIPGEPTPDQSQEILPLSAFEFKQQVQPKFPQYAADRNISGWVDLRFLVNTKGKTENIEIMDAEPKGSFEKAATRAVSKWRFKPLMVDGTPVEKFSIVRLRFDAQ
jgi:TonB family protein